MTLGTLFLPRALFREKRLCVTVSEIQWPRRAHFRWEDMILAKLHRTAQIQRLSLDTAAFGHHFQSEVPTKFTGEPHQTPKGISIRR
jgi:hypothetical protein